MWINGSETERSTGTADREEATREAPKIYAREVTAAERKPKRIRAGAHDLGEVLGLWITSLRATLSPGSIRNYEDYSVFYLDHFGALHNINDLMCKNYMLGRLLRVQAVTVRKELSGLRKFIGWAIETGFLNGPIKVAPVPKGVLGTVYTDMPKRKAAIEVSPEECQSIIDRLPEWSTSKRVKKFPIRAKFVVGYAEGIRPSTLERLFAPIHYRVGSSTLMITRDIDKKRYGREIPLSDVSRKAFEAVCPAEGPIFGKHDIREHIYAAALDVLGEERAEVFCGAHFRSARITHWCETSKNVAGIMYNVGLTRIESMYRYMRPSFRAAQDLKREQEAPPAGKQQKAAG